ncbi:ribose 5-phosphate isomerase [Xylariaceae sp. FL0662B]|nr:ribose 5-phosphate isomerase [Xylariaceae sp. FL0662B]
MNPSIPRILTFAPIRLGRNPRALYSNSRTLLKAASLSSRSKNIPPTSAFIFPVAAATAPYSTTGAKRGTMAPPTTSLIETAKEAACRQAVADHFSADFKYVGIGSGSTVAYVVQAIAELGPDVTGRMKFVPTGSGSTALIRDAGLRVLQVPELLAEIPTPTRQPIDIYFDGADEVDAELNCIKGGGACHFQEKLVSRLARRFVCVADSRKKVDRLLTNWAYVPVEVAPMAAEYVLRELVAVGSSDPKIRTSGPTSARTVTDNHNYIIDAPFPTLLLDSEADKLDPARGLWTPSALLARLRGVFGVLEVGIFSGLNGPQVAELGPDAEGVKPVKAYFGRADGGVETLG